MKTCPYCTAEISNEALKCRFCGEWVTEPPLRRGVVDQSLGRAANRFVSFSVAAAIVGFVLTLVFFFAFILPIWQENRRRIDEIERNDPWSPNRPPVQPGR